MRPEPTFGKLSVGIFGDNLVMMFGDNLQMLITPDVAREFAAGLLLKSDEVDPMTFLVWAKGQNDRKSSLTSSPSTDQGDALGIIQILVGRFGISKDVLEAALYMDAAHSGK